MLEMDQCVDAMADLPDGPCIGDNAIALIGCHAPLLLLDQAIDGLAYLALVHHRATSHSRLVTGRSSASIVSNCLTRARTPGSTPISPQRTESGCHTEMPVLSTRTPQPGYFNLNASAIIQRAASHVIPLISSGRFLSCDS